MTTSTINEGGSTTLELVILAPALLLVLSLALLAGRVETASGAVEQAAAAAARSASLARTPTLASAAARTAVKESLDNQDLTCGTVTVGLDTSGFGAPAGTSSVVRVTVACSVALADLSVPGVPGTRVIRAAATSPLDTYRAR